MSPILSFLASHPELIKYVASAAGSVGRGANAPSVLPDPADIAEEILEEEEEDYAPTTLRQLQRIVKSDVDLKNPKKYIGQLVKHKHKLTPKDVQLMLKEFNDFEGFDTGDAHSWDDSVLDGYARHIKNYKYKYKDEAQKLDPSIDPETQHIGPMAQDIEEVNPAAIITDPETGYKSVDTGRLALMNAGAIAEIARELKGIKQEGVVK
jgi:hypothetical protein